ncbi:MAG: hypothetical protein ABWZ68_05775, partial [Acidimicrobiales bacterium]
MRVRVVGSGRAGGALALALHRVGWTVEAPLGRDDDLSASAHGVDLLVLATPDPVIAEVAGTVEPDRDTVVAHLAGALGLDVLAGEAGTLALGFHVGLEVRHGALHHPGALDHLGQEHL